MAPKIQNRSRLKIDAISNYFLNNIEVLQTYSTMNGFSGNGEYACSDL